MDPEVRSTTGLGGLRAARRNSLTAGEASVSVRVLPSPLRRLSSRIGTADLRPDRKGDRVGGPAYFVAPLDEADWPMVVAVQDAVLGQMTGARFEPQSPDRFHLTLIYCEEATDDQVASALRSLYALPAAFSVELVEVTTFPKSEDHPVVLRANPSPALLRLVTDLGMALTRAGARLSDYSLPRNYQPHLTIAHNLQPANTPLGRLDAPFEATVSEFVVSRGDYEETLHVRLPATVGERVLVTAGPPWPMRHYGPGEHPGTGTPQEAHAGGDGQAARRPPVPGGQNVPHIAVSVGREHGIDEESAHVIARFDEVMRQSIKAYKPSQGEMRRLRDLGLADEDITHAFALKERAYQALLEMRRRYYASINPSIERHYGPGSHPGTGTEQQVHAGGDGAAKVYPYASSAERIFGANVGDVASAVDTMLRTKKPPEGMTYGPEWPEFQRSIVDLDEAIYAVHPGGSAVELLTGKGGRGDYFILRDGTTVQVASHDQASEAIQRLLITAKDPLISVPEGESLKWYQLFGETDVLPQILGVVRWSNNGPRAIGVSWASGVTVTDKQAEVIGQLARLNEAVDTLSWSTFDLFTGGGLYSTLHRDYGTGLADLLMVRYYAGPQEVHDGTAKWWSSKWTRGTARHYGPGEHPGTGTPQEAHAGGDGREKRQPGLRRATALMLIPRTARWQPVRDAAEAIAKVHGLPTDLQPLKVVPVKFGAQRLGRLIVEIQRLTGELKVRNLGIQLVPEGEKRVGVEEHVELTAAHEFGHYLDWTVFATKTEPSGDWGDFVAKPVQGSRGLWYQGLGDGSLAGVLTAVKESNAYQQLSEFKSTSLPWPGDPSGIKLVYDFQTTRYLREPEELFARAYSQYIAERSGNKEMRAGVESLRTAARAGHAPQAWEADDFEPIADAFDDLFESKGWR